MPTYEYMCPDCEHVWEESSKIADRNLPLESPCPNCGGENVKQKLGALGICDPIRMGRQKPPAGFNEVLRNIQKISPGNTIKVRD